MSVCVRVCMCACVRLSVCVQERRLAAVRELVRLLKPGGQALIYVWAMEQEYNKQKSKYLKDAKDKENQQLQLSTESGDTKHPAENHATTDQEEHPAEKQQITPPNSAVPATSIAGSPPKLSVHTNRTAFNSQDLLVPWHLKGGDNDAKKQAGHSSTEAAVAAAGAPTAGAPPVFHRYYHVFQKGELEALCNLVEDVEIRTSYHDQGNWCVILQKLSK